MLRESLSLLSLSLSTCTRARPHRGMHTHTQTQRCILSLSMRPPPSSARAHAHLAATSFGLLASVRTGLVCALSYVSVSYLYGMRVPHSPSLSPHPPSHARPRLRTHTRTPGPGIILCLRMVSVRAADCHGR